MVCITRRLAAFLILALLFASVSYAQQAAEPLRAGDVAMIRDDDTELLLNDKVQARLEKGQAFQIAKVRDDWVAGFVEIDGQRQPGWVKREQLQLDEALTGAAPIERALAALKTLGANVERNEEGKVVSAEASGKLIVDDALRHFAALPHLETLTINSPNVTDAGLTHLSNLQQLQKLYLVDTAVTDEGLKRLSNLERLESLALVGADIDGSGMSHLMSLPNLAVLNLSRSKIGNEGLENVGGLLGLHTLALVKTSVTDDGLRGLSTLDQMRTLNLNDCEITGAGLDHLEGMKKLRLLHVRGADLTKKRIKQFNDKLPSAAVFK